MIIKIKLNAADLAKVCLIYGVADEIGLESIFTERIKTEFTDVLITDKIATEKQAVKNRLI